MPRSEILEELNGVHQALVGRHRPGVTYPPDDQHQHGKDHVDQCRRWLEEIVVVGRNELAELVDEGAKAYPPDQGSYRPDTRCDEGQQDSDCDNHAQSAPKDVGNVETSAADLRVVRCLQVDAQRQDRQDRSNQKEVQGFGLGASNQTPQPSGCHGQRLAASRRQGSAPRGSLQCSWWPYIALL